MSKFEYVKLADAIAVDIANGTLRPGDRLPPQRNFAYDRGIAVSTASRVYTELLRRGLDHRFLAIAGIHAPKARDTVQKLVPGCVGHRRALG